MNGKIHGDKALRRGFSALQMLYWCSYGSSTTYIVSYVKAVRNANDTTAGLLLAIFMLCACVGQFGINSICDKFQNNRKVFSFGMLACLAVWYGVYFSSNMPLLFVVYGLMGIVQPALAAVLDTWVIRSFPGDPNAYSPIRAMASLAYSSLMLVMGFAIDSIGHVVMLVLPTVFFIGGALMAWFMPEIPALTQPVESHARAKVGLGVIQPIVWMFIVAMAIMGTANMPLLNMNLQIMENVGGTVTHSGIAVSCNTIAEFLTMRYGAVILRTLSARKKLLLAGMLYLGSTLIILLVPNVFALYLAFFVNGVAYGIILPSRRQFINETVPESLLNRLHGVSDIAYTNTGGLLGNLMSGRVLDTWGVQVMVGISWALEAISVAIMTTFKRFMKHESGKKGIDTAA